MFPIFTILALGAVITFLPEEQVTAGDAAEEVREVGAFDGLAVDGSLTVEVKRGAPARVVVIGPATEREDVETYVKDNTLHVTGGGAVKVRVTAPALREAAVAGSGRIVGEGSWKSESLSVAIAGSGELSMAIEADNLEVAVSGSGRVALTGQARHAKVAIQGSGSVELGVKERLEAAIAGSGSVLYHGTDDVKVAVATSGSGRVRRAD